MHSSLQRTDWATRTGLFLLLLVSALVPLVIFPGYESIPEHAKVSVLVALTALVSGCVLLSGVRIAAILPEFAGRSLVVWLALLTLSTLLSVSIDRSLFGIHYRYNGLLLHVVYACLCIGTAWCIRSNPDLLRWILRIVIGAGIVQILIGGMQYAGFHPLNPFDSGERIRPIGTLSTANLYSGFMVLACIATVGLFMQEKRISLTFFLWLVLLGITTCLRIGSSRGCWLVSGVGVMLLVLIALVASGKEERNSLLVRAHAIGLAFLLGFALFPPEHYVPGASRMLANQPVSADLNTFLHMDATERMESSFQSEDLTRRTRFELWNAAGTIWWRHPWFGSGPDTFSCMYQGLRSVENMKAYGPESVAHDAHNIFLHNLATWGALPTAAWLAFLGYTLLAWLTLLRTHHKQRISFATAGLMLFGALALQLLVVGSISHNTLIYMLAGIILGSLPQCETHTHTPSRMKTIAGGCILLVSLPLAIQPVLVQQHFTQAWRDLNANNTVRAIERYRSVLNRFPWREEYYEQLIAVLIATSATEENMVYLEEAERLSDEAIARFPMQSRLHALRGRVLAIEADQLGNESITREALDAFRKATELHPVQPQYQGWRGEMAERLGLLNEAIEAYRKAASLGNESQHHYFQQALESVVRRNESTSALRDE